VHLKVTFSTHLVTHTTVAPFEVTVSPPCDSAVINLAWVGVTSPHTYQIGSTAVDFAYTAPLDSAYSHCTGVVELQEFDPVSTTWNVITGPDMTLDSGADKVTLSTSNLALDLAPVQVTSSYKLVAYSTATASPKYEVLLDITWEHPCRSAAFSDPVLISMVSSVRSGVPITQAVAPFTVPSPLDCGTQSIEIVDQPFGTYSLSDFLTYSATTSDISLSPLLDVHEGVYNVNLKVTFSTHLGTHTTAAPFQVTVLPPCD